MMTPQDHSSVVVNFEIDHRDLFRANLELTKWRFLLGIIVVAVLSCGVIYFFLLIGERDILLETSPLFIGLPWWRWVDNYCACTPARENTWPPFLNRSGRFS